MAHRWVHDCSMKTNGFSRKEICQTIGKDKSVLSRELKRNSCSESGKYREDRAQNKHEVRQSQKAKKEHFTKK